MLRRVVCGFVASFCVVGWGAFGARAFVLLRASWPFFVISVLFVDVVVFCALVGDLCWLLPPCHVCVVVLLVSEWWRGDAQCEGGGCPSW